VRSPPGAGLARRAREWADRQDGASYRGAGIDAWKRYRAVEGPLQSALLSAYLLVAVLPAILVFEEYVETSPASLSGELVHHLHLNGPSARALEGVLLQNRAHELGSALFAIGGALAFGLGFGRVLQLVHVRAWRLELRARELDHLRYAIVLGAVYGLVLVLIAQFAELGGRDAWVRWALTPVWIVVLVAFFVWAPRLLTRGLISQRDLLPGAVLTAVGLVLWLVVSRFLIGYWVDLYARDYGGFGVVMAVFFWIAIGSTLVVAAAAVSPALAQRRALRQ
jgi:uncharacterized BrkB/YihY/UPF0761 family membrane protein